MRALQLPMDEMLSDLPSLNGKWGDLLKLEHSNQSAYNFSLPKYNRELHQAVKVLIRPSDPH